MCLPVSFQILKELLFSRLQGKYLNVNLGILMLTLQLESTKPGNSRVMPLNLSSSLAFCARYFKLCFCVFFKFFSSQQHVFIIELAFCVCFGGCFTMCNYWGLVVSVMEGVTLIMIG